MSKFETEVLTTLARIETKQEAQDARLSKIEKDMSDHNGDTKSIAKQVYVLWGAAAAVVALEILPGILNIIGSG